MFPRPFRRGDTVMLVSPSSPLASHEPLQEIVRVITEMGYRVKVGESCLSGTSRGYCAADPAVKAADIHRGFSDPDVKGIWCTRGGSTAWQVLPYLDFDLIAANAKPFIGFSDITTLHMAFQRRSGLVTFHGPTANRVLTWQEEDFSRSSLLRAMSTEQEMLLENPPGKEMIALRPGKAEGVLVGGNLSMVVSALATPWQPDWQDKILYLEEVGEGVYRLERMLTQLRYAGVLDQVSGVLLGDFTRCGNSYCEAYGPKELLADFFSGYHKPVLFGLQSAHCAPMVTLPMGCMCRLDGDRGDVWIEKK